MLREMGQGERINEIYHRKFYKEITGSGRLPVTVSVMHTFRTQKSVA